MIELRFPLVIDENGDVSLFWTMDEVHADIEAIDVRNDEYVAYDASGRRLSLGVREPSDVLQVALAEDEPNHVNEVRDLLERYISARKPAMVKTDCRLEQLIDMITSLRLRN